MPSVTRRLKRYLFVALPLFGFLEAMERSRLHFYRDTSQVKIGPLADCYVETAGYALMAIAMLIIWSRQASRVFYVGWTPVILFAIVKVGFELTGYTADSMGSYGIPISFYSLGLALAVWIMFLIAQKQNR